MEPIPIGRVLEKNGAGYTTGLALVGLHDSIVNRPAAVS
jgi:hypothetical protein